MGTLIHRLDVASHELALPHHLPPAHSLAKSTSMHFSNCSLYKCKENSPALLENHGKAIQIHEVECEPEKIKQHGSHVNIPQKEGSNEGREGKKKDNNI